MGSYSDLSMVFRRENYDDIMKYINDEFKVFPDKIYNYTHDSHYTAMVWKQLKYGVHYDDFIRYLQDNGIDYTISYYGEWADGGAEYVESGRYDIPYMYIRQEFDLEDFEETDKPRLINPIEFIRKEE